VFPGTPGLLGREEEEAEEDGGLCPCAHVRMCGGGREGGGLGEIPHILPQEGRVGPGKMAAKF
jgi:hypothetical protein